MVFRVSNLNRDQKRMREPAVNIPMSLQPPAAVQSHDSRLKLRAAETEAARLVDVINVEVVIVVPAH
jgi:hypothetical protein